MVMGDWKNSCVFNFAILLKSRKSQKFDAHKIYMCDAVNTQYLTCAQNLMGSHLGYHVTLELKSNEK